MDLNLACMLLLIRAFLSGSTILKMLKMLLFLISYDHHFSSPSLFSWLYFSMILVLAKDAPEAHVYDNTFLNSNMGISIDFSENNDYTGQVCFAQIYFI